MYIHDGAFKWVLVKIISIYTCNSIWMHNVTFRTSTLNIYQNNLVFQTICTHTRLQLIIMINCFNQFINVSNRSSSLQQMLHIEVQLFQQFTLIIYLSWSHEFITKWMSLDCVHDINCLYQFPILRNSSFSLVAPPVNRGQGFGFLL